MILNRRTYGTSQKTDRTANKLRTAEAKVHSIDNKGLQLRFYAMGDSKRRLLTTVLLLLLIL